MQDKNIQEKNVVAIQFLCERYAEILPKLHNALKDHPGNFNRLINKVFHNQYGYGYKCWSSTAISHAADFVSATLAFKSIYQGQDGKHIIEKAILQSLDHSIVQDCRLNIRAL